MTSSIKNYDLKGLLTKQQCTDLDKDYQYYLRTFKPVYLNSLSRSKVLVRFNSPPEYVPINGNTYDVTVNVQDVDHYVE